MKRNKILYIHHGAGGGGASNSLFLLVSSLNKSDYEPVVLLGMTGPLVEWLKSKNIKTYIKELSTFYYGTHSRKLPAMQIGYFLARFLPNIVTVYRLIKNEKLEVIKIGKRIIIDKTNIEDLINSHSRTYIPDQIENIKANFNINNYYYIGEIINIFGISEKGLYTLLINHSVDKVQIGSYTYVLKSDIKKLLGKSKNLK